MMDINYISTNILKDFEERFIGWFVYLREDDIEHNKPKGLYFGGENGFERLTNNDYTLIEPTSNIPVPVFPENNMFNFTGEEITFNPVNINDIIKYVNIYNNSHVDAGTYTILVSLKFEDWTWSDGTSEPKEFTYTINPEHVSSATVQLSKSSCEYGEEIPYVVDVMYQDNILVKNVDYEVIYPDKESNVITINFIGNYEGSIKKTFTLIPKKIDKPTLSNNVFYYTGEDIIVYPTNWDDIKEYCYIEEGTNIGRDAGEYTMVVYLKNTRNFVWKEDNSTLPVSKLFVIGTVEVEVPEWDFDYVYNVDYNGEQYEFLPTNWDNIKDYVNISNNINTCAGTYEITISLKVENLRWSDNTVIDKKHVYTINKLIVERPVWGNVKAGTYNGKYYTYEPVNWNSISEFCLIENNVQVNAGVYEVVVSLKDKINYGWVGPTGVVYSDDLSTEFEILKAKGFFTTGPYIHGNFYVDDDVYCIAMYIDNTCELTYEWYRNTTATLKGATFITSSKSNEYRITHDDVGYFLICNVVAKSTSVSNYMGSESFAPSRLKVAKTILYDSFDFDTQLYEDSIPSTQTTYTLPGIKKYSNDDESIVEYNIVSGTDVAELWDIYEGVLVIKGVGDVIVEATIKNSKNYIYSPDTIRFILHVYSEDVVLWGLYDKESKTPENETIMKGLIPENAKRAILKENEKGINSILFRKDFPYKTFYGDVQNYYGWYVLIPFDKKLIRLCENNVLNLDIESCKMKNEDGSDLILTTSENRKYRVYGDFNIARTSDNWMLHILFRAY